MSLRALILDCDGVLADTERLHFRAFRDALEPEGVALTAGRYRSSLLGLDDAACLAAALRAGGAPPDPGRVDRALRRKRAAYRRLLAGDLPPVPGAAAFVRAAASRLRLAVASGSRREEVERVLAGLGIAGLIETVVADEDAQRGKPDPEPYRAALERLRARSPLAARECLAVEDSPVGIRAARAAGMRVVAPTTSYPPGELAEADRVAGSFRELSLPALERLLK